MQAIESQFTKISIPSIRTGTLLDAANVVHNDTFPNFYVLGIDSH